MQVGKLYLQRKYVALVHAVLGKAPWGHARSPMEMKVDFCFRLPTPLNVRVSVQTIGCQMSPLLFVTSAVRHLCGIETRVLLKARSVWEESQGGVLTVQKLMPKTDDLVVENSLLERLGELSRVRGSRPFSALSLYFGSVKLSRWWHQVAL